MKKGERRVGVVQEVICWIDVPDRLNTTDEVCAWLTEHDRWPNVIDGDWTSRDFIFPEGE